MLKVRLLNHDTRSRTTNADIVRAGKTWDMNLGGRTGCWLCRGYNRDQFLAVIHGAATVTVHMERVFVRCPRHTTDDQVQRLVGWLPDRLGNGGLICRFKQNNLLLDPDDVSTMLREALCRTVARLGLPHVVACYYKAHRFADWVACRADANFPHRGTEVNVWALWAAIAEAELHLDEA